MTRSSAKYNASPVSPPRRETSKNHSRKTGKTKKRGHTVEHKKIKKTEADREMDLALF